MGERLNVSFKKLLVLMEANLCELCCRNKFMELLHEEKQTVFSQSELKDLFTYS